ncbi:MAG: HigA family addiction module antitoxin [Pseudomonadota bacterium]
MAVHEKDRGWSPEWAVHPGEHLEEYLELLELSQAEAARRVGISTKVMSTIIRGKNPVSADTALKLEKVFGLAAHVWLNIQAQWDLYEQREKAAKAVSAKDREWVKQFPLSDLKRRGVLPDVKDVGKLLDPLLSFLKIGSASGFESRFASLNVQHRQSKSHKTSDYHIAAWLLLGEWKARSFDVPDFDAELFRDAITEIRKLTNESPSEFEGRMRDLCLQAGVVVNFEPPIKKTSLYGSTLWVDDRFAVVQMSLRGKTNDHFWWTFFHEAGHVLLHRGKTFADEKGFENPEEQEADRFAEEILVGSERLVDFIATKPRSGAEVTRFASDVGVHPGIVVGMLQHRKVIPYSHLRKLMVKFEFNEER